MQLEMEDMEVEEDISLETGGGDWYATSVCFLLTPLLHHFSAESMAGAAWLLGQRGKL